jgi:hypothetical protein
LAIAFGSVTHRDLFLENSIKLPLLNVDLSLVGFFVVAPSLLVIFHFYVFLQLLGLAITAKGYGALLAIDVPDVSDRQYVRRRLDVFPILRFLAGPRDQRTGFFGFSLRLIAWITLVATPVLILLQAQVTFLPYHREWIVWLQRVAVLLDLVPQRNDCRIALAKLQPAYVGTINAHPVCKFKPAAAVYSGQLCASRLPP